MDNIISFLEDNFFVMLFLAVLLFWIIFFFIRLIRKMRRYAYCPKCDCKMKLKLVTKEEERSMMSRLRRNFHAKNAYAVYLVLRCPHCGHEIKI